MPVQTEMKGLEGRERTSGKRRWRQGKVMSGTPRSPLIWAVAAAAGQTGGRSPPHHVPASLSRPLPAVTPPRQSVGLWSLLIISIHFPHSSLSLSLSLSLDAAGIVRCVWSPDRSSFYVLLDGTVNLLFFFSLFFFFRSAGLADYSCPSYSALFVSVSRGWTVLVSVSRGKLMD